MRGRELHADDVRGAVWNPKRQRWESCSLHTLKHCHVVHATLLQEKVARYRARVIRAPQDRDRRRSKRAKYDDEEERSPRKEKKKKYDDVEDVSPRASKKKKSRRARALTFTIQFAGRASLT